KQQRCSRFFWVHYSEAERHSADGSSWAPEIRGGLSTGQGCPCGGQIGAATRRPSAVFDPCVRATGLKASPPH
ncbi:unnamed protein product, partial [Heterosigma akashiwo]